MVCKNYLWAALIGWDLHLIEQSDDVQQEASGLWESEMVISAIFSAYFYFLFIFLLP